MAAAVTVLAAIDVVELRPVTGVLECRVSILGFTWESAGLASLVCND